MNTVIKLNNDIFPTKTLAAILVEQRKPLVIDEIELPDHLDVGQVLVELAYSGICGSQLGEIDGVKGPDKFLPHLLGHEGSGRVLAIGPGVTTVAPGDSVVAHWRPSNGIQSPVPAYRWRTEHLKAGWVTTFNRHAVVSENRLTPIPPHVDLQVAALYGCAITTGFGVIDNLSNLKLGEHVVVFGAGGVGLNVIQACYLAGASKIFAVDRFSNRLALAERCGATDLIDAKADDPWEVLGSLTHQRRPDLFVDNTGDPEIIEKGYAILNDIGRLLLVGVPNHDRKASIFTLPLHFGKVITGTHGGEAQPHIDIPRYASLANERNIDFKNLISDVKPLTSINKLISNIRSGAASGRCIVEL